MNRSKLFAACLSVFISGFLVRAADAATLRILPASGSFEQGTTLTAGVYVSSPDQAMNAASGIVSFPTDLLQVVSISKSGSIATLWVQEPSYSNFDGTVNFEGVVLNPGFKGSSGKLLDVRFRVRTTGTANVRFASGAVLANDGKGTNILEGLEGAAYILKEAPPAPPASSEPSPIRAPASATSSAGKLQEESRQVTTEVPSRFSLARRLLAEWGSVILITIALAGLILGLLYFVVHRLQMTQVRLKKELWRFRRTLHGDLKEFQRDLSAAKKEEMTVHVTLGKLEKMRRGIKEEVAAIERDIEKEMKTLEKIERE